MKNNYSKIGFIFTLILYIDKIIYKQREWMKRLYH